MKRALEVIILVVVILLVCGMVFTFLDHPERTTLLPRKTSAVIEETTDRTSNTTIVQSTTGDNSANIVGSGNQVVVQTTRGKGSPAIAGVTGNVVINATPGATVVCINGDCVTTKDGENDATGKVDSDGVPSDAR